MEMLGEKEHLAFKAAALEAASARHRVIVTEQPEPKTVTPYLLRQFMVGMSQTALDALPSFLKGQLESIGRRMQRQAFRAHKRDIKARQYRAVALSGGGKREVARRVRQSARMPLRWRKDLRVA